MPLITKFKLNTCVPYIIKYPNPAFDTKNSPITTPIKDMEIFNFKEETIVCKLAGITSLSNICFLVAPNDFSNLILLASIFKKPLYIVIILTIKLINKAMTIIDLTFAPIQIIKIGPKATLGRELIKVKNGSITLAINLNEYKIIAINKPKTIPKIKAMAVSIKVVKICVIKLPFNNKSLIVLKIKLGDEKIKLFKIPTLVKISHKLKIKTIKPICVIKTNKLNLFSFFISDEHI